MRVKIALSVFTTPSLLLRAGARGFAAHPVDDIWKDQGTLKEDCEGVLLARVDLLNDAQDALPRRASSWGSQKLRAMDPVISNRLGDSRNARELRRCHRIH